MYCKIISISKSKPFWVVLAAFCRVINSTLTSWALGLRMSALYKRTQQQNWPHLMEAHGYRLLDKCLARVNGAHLNSACPPASCSMISLLCLEGNGREQHHYISSIWIQGQADKRALIKTSTQNEAPICAFGLSEVAVMLSVSFEWHTEELVYCISDISRVKHNLYDAIMWPSIWLDRSLKRCFIGSLSSCLGKTLGNVIHMCFHNSLQCMERWISTSEILSLPSQRRARGQYTHWIYISIK